MEARELRDSRVVPGWCAAVESLLDAADVIARYPWLGPWADRRLDLKIRHAEELRLQAARLVDSAALITAAAADRIPQPELPAADPAFAVLGSTSEARSALLGLWYRWHSAVCDGWLMPHEYSGGVVHLKPRR
jgi:outer membrane protein TolC